MDRVYIRIPLKRVVAGDYKVGLTPRTAEGEPSLYVNGGWIDPKGNFHALAKYSDLHEKLAQKLGFPTSKDALIAGWIRISNFTTDFGIEIEALTDDARSRIIDFLQGANPEKAVALEWYKPKTGNRYFWTVESALDSLENRRVNASGTDDLDRSGWLLKDGSFVGYNSKHDCHYDIACRIGLVSKNLLNSLSTSTRLNPVLKDGNVRVVNDGSDDVCWFQAWAPTEATRKLIARAIDRVPLGRRIMTNFQNPGDFTFENDEGMTPAQAKNYLLNGARPSELAMFHEGSTKVAISLPTLVQETNAFSVKNRPGCSATLKKSDPKDLFLEYNVKCNLKDSDPSGHDVRVHFDVSKVEETEKAKDLDVRVSCACPAFLYWGGQWNLHQRDGLEGEPRPMLQAPTERLDLRSNFVICKHCKAVFERILPAVQNNINNILRKLRVKQYEEEVKEKGIKPPTIRRQPGQLTPEDKDVAQKLREGIEEREREKLLKDQGIVKRTPEVVEIAPRKPSEEPLEELEPYLPQRDFEDLKNLEDSERKKLLEEMPPPPGALETEPNKIEEHPEKPHVHTGLPYERKEEPKWKQWINKLKDRVKKWKGQEEKPPYRKFTTKRKKSMITLGDVLPSEFRIEHMESRAAKFFNMGVLHEFNSRENPWPGPEKNVSTWWELANGYIVGWNESPTRGWSFPVRKSNKKALLLGKL